MVIAYEGVLNNGNDEENTVIINLHNWNGASCISKQAYELASKMKVKLLTRDDFYEYINDTGICLCLIWNSHI